MQPSSPPSSPGPISRLPSELIGTIILECCTSDEADKVMDKKALLSTSLLSHLWRAESVRYLFRKLAITSDKPGNIKSLKPFVEFLNHSPHLRSHVVQLKLEQNNYSRLKLHAGDVAGTVQLLPNLDSLDIELANVEDTGANDDDQDTIVANPNGKLIIDHLSIQQPYRPVIIAQYLSHFSKIKTLKIVSDGTGGAGKVPKPTSNSTLEVESLELAAYSSHLDTLRPIIQPSSLTSIVLIAVSNIKVSSLYAFLDIHGAHLRSFKYVAQDTSQNIAVLGGSCLSTCNQLRTVSFRLDVIYSMHVETLVSECNACIKLITNIPAELEHVTLDIPISHDMRLSGQHLDLYEVQETVISLPWTSIRDVVNKFPTLEQVEVIFQTPDGPVGIEYVVRIQEEVRSKLGENIMKKVNIRAGAWEGQDAVYESDSDDRSCGVSLFE